VLPRAAESGFIESALRPIVKAGGLIVPSAPLAVFAAWRTWEHAKRFRRGQGRGWQGVAEAGAVGGFLPLVVLLFAFVRLPASVPARAIAAVGAWTVVGLALGLLLRLSAMLVLRLIAPPVDRTGGA
jgi:hypothetical protein